MKLNYISSNAVNFSINKKVLAVLTAIALSISGLAYAHEVQVDAEIAAIKANPAYNISRADLAKAFPSEWTNEVTE